MKRTSTSKIPSQNQLVFPLLEIIEENGGSITPRQAADKVAERIGLSGEERAEKVFAGEAAGYVNRLDRDVRWARQMAVARGLVASGGKAIWELTEAGSDKLRNCRPGVVITVYETDRGVALWAECQSAAGYVDNEFVDLILTSPPYPLLRQKEYGNLDEKAHIEWLFDCIRHWYPKLKETGSLVLNMGDAWQKGTPTMSLYQERLTVKLVDELGLHLAQRFFWENPSKMPTPAEWVTIRRVRVTNSVEPCLWFSKTPFPAADNRRVLRAYSERMKQRLVEGGDKAMRRPSGHQIAAGAFSADNGGSIAHNLLTIPNTASNSRYIRECKASGLPVHPARFPAGLAEFFIKFLTKEGDVVADIFGGSGTVAAKCEQLQRNWLSIDKSLTYTYGSQFSFDQGTQLRWLLNEAAA